MKQVTIYHNPKCSKSRETLALLKDKNITPTIILYLDTPPSMDEIKALLKKLNFSSARELMRRKEELYKELDLDNPLLTEEQLIDMLHHHPKLIERPIVVVGELAKLGRPVENILEIL